MNYGKSLGLIGDKQHDKNYWLPTELILSPDMDSHTPFAENNQHIHK